MAAKDERLLVATRLRPAERDAIYRLAEENQRTVSGEVRRAILRHLKTEVDSIRTNRGDPP
jgi:hypothetical protein